MEDSKSNTKTLKIEDRGEEILTLDVVDDDPERNTDIVALSAWLGEIVKFQERAASEIHSICCRTSNTDLILQILDKLPADRKQALCQTFLNKVNPINKSHNYKVFQKLADLKALEVIWARRNDTNINWEVELGSVLCQQADFEKAIEEDLFTSKGHLQIKEDMIAKWEPTGLLNGLKSDNEEFMIATLAQVFINFIVFFGEYPEAAFIRVQPFQLIPIMITRMVRLVTKLNNKEEGFRAKLEE
jgi:hypothetical protein